MIHFCSIFLYKGFDGSDIISLVILAVLICISAFASGSETALFSLSPGDIRTVKNRGNKSDEAILKLLSTEDYTLATILILNNLVNIIIVILSNNIIDSLVYYMSSALTDVPNGIAAVGMVIVQNILNFFIPSGSGQAAVSMPIMANLADSIGMHRQIAVLAFQFGDGFSNMFWPTVIATECGIMGIPLQKWYKFAWPLFIMMFALQVVLIVVATMIGYQ